MARLGQAVAVLKGGKGARLLDFEVPSLHFRSILKLVTSAATMALPGGEIYSAGFGLRLLMTA